MNQERFSFALERLVSGDWARFERFASEFLVHDYGQIRTVAAPSGDLGRDSELFSPDGESPVLLQYSVTKDWTSKIRQTAKRVKENFPKASILIYVTNQIIGADADKLKKELRNADFKLVLDVHDRSWFLDRLKKPPEREELAEKLAIDIVDPYLDSKGVIESKSPALSGFESKAAVLHLQLQWEDDSRDKGLTKLSYEALVKSVLRDTVADQRMSRTEIHQAIHKILPNHTIESVAGYVDSALTRLEKRSIRHWPKEDEYCLTHEEALHVRDGITRKEIKSRTLDREVIRTLNEYFDEPLPEEDAVALSERTRRILDRFLLKKGEEFASAVTRGETVKLHDDTVDVMVTNDFAENPDRSRLGADAVLAVRSALVEVLQRSSATVKQYLREVADGYTLFGFLQAVPDVQKVMQKVFRDGEIWLDTSVLLPVLAETLLPDEALILSPLLRAASAAGMKLRVTNGVIEEVERHINRCIVYQKTAHGQWSGGVPFLFAMHSLSGSSMDFALWCQNFCGRERAMDDIRDYLLSDWGIENEDLQPFVDSSPERLRWRVSQIWREAHESRRNAGQTDIEEFIIDRLVAHDVECFLGVVGKRKQAMAHELGYSHWFLTFDKTVRDIEQRLKVDLGIDAPKAPVMSPDFLANYLAVGPVRSRVSKSSEATLPLALFDLLSENIPAELIQAAEAVRSECGAVSERIVRRKLRDLLDSFKQHRGDIAAGGFKALKAKLEKAFAETKQ